MMPRFGKRLTKRIPGIAVVAAALLVPAALPWGCDLLNIATPSSLSITAVPTGCGTKVSSTETINWSIRFSVDGADPAAPVEWFFSDGTSATGQTVVHTFDTRASESSVSGEHQPVDIDVTVTSGGQSLTRTIEVPMRGEPDGGGDPNGDTCMSDEGRTHAANGTLLCYANNPPSSGPHLSAAGVAPVGAGFFDEALASERWVHDLEHGAVVLLYDCGGPCSDELKAQLQALFDAIPVSPRFNEKKMVITRYSGINPACGGAATFPGSGPFLAIAWNVQRPFATLDTAGIIEFYNRHVDRGPEDAPLPP